MAETMQIDTRVLARISRMELIARQAVEGFLSGKHPSPFFGSSVEYADHRPYTLGDEIRMIDWKMMAKTDKCYVKLFAEQTNLRATLLLDVSRSMGGGAGTTDVPTAGAKAGGKNAADPAQGPAVTKLTFAAQLAAAVLGYLMLCQNDAVGLCTFDQQVRSYIPPRCTPTHYRRVLESLQQAKPEHSTRVATVLHEMAGRLKRRGLIIVLSDLLDEVDKLADGLAHFRFNKHEVIVFHIMSDVELTFPFTRMTRFKDAEGDGHVIANPGSVRAKYLERLNHHLERVKQACLERDVGYQLCRTSQSYDQMLMAYLQQRSRWT